MLKGKGTSKNKIPREMDEFVRITFQILSLAKYLLCSMNKCYAKCNICISILSSLYDLNRNLKRFYLIFEIQNLMWIIKLIYLIIQMHNKRFIFGIQISGKSKLRILFKRQFKYMERLSLYKYVSNKNPKIMLMVNMTECVQTNISYR